MTYFKRRAAAAAAFAKSRELLEKAEGMTDTEATAAIALSDAWLRHGHALVAVAR